MELTSIHPGVYLLYYFIMALLAFIFNDPYFVLTFLVLLIVLIALQGISSELKNILKFFLPLTVMIMILNPVFNKTGVHRIFIWNNFFVTYEAIAYGILMSLLFSLSFWCVHLTTNLFHIRKCFTYSLKSCR